MVEAILKMALIAAMWELGSVSSNLVRMRRGFVEGTLESPAIFALIMRWCCANWYRVGVRESYAGRSTLVVHRADDVVLLAKSTDAAQTMVSESIQSWNPHSENFRFSSWSYDVEGHAKKCVERYCELANNSTQQLCKVSTPCIDDHHFKEEEMKSVGELSKSMLSNCSEMLILGTYWTT